VEVVVTAGGGWPVQPIVRVLAVISVVTIVAVCVPRTAQAAVAGNDGPSGTVTVGASNGGSIGGAPGDSIGGEGGGGQGGSPWLCTYTTLTLNDEGGIAPGGPTPGSWYSVTCTDLLTGASTTETEWIPDQSATDTPAVNPYSVARQAENSLRLPSPNSYFNPSDLSVVNLATWLWINADIWHPYSVTASVGSVSATAVATPSSVTWSMGDGGMITCYGPGTPFDSTQPSSPQSTQCAYTYAISSAGQPSPDGDPNDDAFHVVTTINWSVSWSVQGAVGGGGLPALSTSTSTFVRVEQVESINSEASDALHRRSLIEGALT
jgi:hypothetical protein